MYGPTVVITTFVDSASARIEPGSFTSASISGRPECSLPSRERTASSLDRLRPASAHRVPGSAWAARYSAVNPPVKPVAPNRTISCWRSDTAGDLPGRLERLRGCHPGPGGHPTGHGRGHSLRGVGGLAGQIQKLAPLLARGGFGPESLCESGDPLFGVHRRDPTLSRSGGGPLSQAPDSECSASDQLRRTSSI